MLAIPENVLARFNEVLKFGMYFAFIVNTTIILINPYAENRT